MSPPFRGATSRGARPGGSPPPPLTPMAGLDGSCFFLKLILHHTLQILKSFIFMQYMACTIQTVLNFVFMHNTNCTKISISIFIFMGSAKLLAKMICISWKNSDLNFVFMQNFVQKSHFLQNHATVAQENWLFCGNPSIEWAPPPYTTSWYKDWVCTLHSGYWFKPAAYSLQAGYLAPGYSRVTLIGQTCKHI